MTGTDLGLHSVAPRLPVSAPASRAVWRELLASDPDALPTQSPEWIDCLCAGGRYVDATRLYQTPAGQRAVLPMVRRARWPRTGDIWHSMPPAWGFGGLVSDGPVTADLVSSVVGDLVSQAALRIHIRPNPLHAEVWARGVAGRAGVTVVPARAHVLDLSGGFDVVWRQRFRSSARTQVRRAERLGVEVETDVSGRLVPELYDLLRKSTERWARHQNEPLMLAHLRRAHRDPMEKLQNIATGLGEACQVSVARYQGRPVAAILVLRGANAHYTRGAMDEALAGPTQANRLLHKAAIEDACRAGCRSYHMGESGGSDGLSQFKSRFGAQAHEYAEYWFEKIPLAQVGRAVRQGAKRAIGFRDG